MMSELSSLFCLPISWELWKFAFRSLELHEIARLLVYLLWAKQSHARAFVKTKYTWSLVFHHRTIEELAWVWCVTHRFVSLRNWKCLSIIIYSNVLSVFVAHPLSWLAWREIQLSVRKNRRNQAIFSCDNFKSNCRLTLDFGGARKNQGQMTWSILRSVF